MSMKITADVKQHHGMMCCATKGIFVADNSSHGLKIRVFFLKPHAPLMIKRIASNAVKDI